MRVYVENNHPQVYDSSAIQHSLIDADYDLSASKKQKPSLASHPQKAGLRAAKARRIPALILQIAALALVLSYAKSENVRNGLEPLALWQTYRGLWGAFLTRLFFCGILPGLFLLAFSKIRPSKPFASFILAALWCGVMGGCASLLYRTQTFFFGSGHDPLTLILKTGVEMFLFAPLFAVPTSAIFYFWVSQGLSLRQLKSNWPFAWIQQIILPQLIPCWSVWGPVMFILYALPESLIIHISGLVGCFMVLMSFQIALHALESSTL